MKVILLAAGEGKRLRPHTEDKPKCLVQLAGVPLLEYQLRALRSSGLTDISIVSGYRAEALRPFELPTFHNPAFAETNMLASLMTARSILSGSEDVLVSYTDIVYQPAVVQSLLASKAPIAISIDRQWRTLWNLRMPDPLSDAETLKLEGSRVTEIGKKPSSYKEIQGQYMGLIKLSPKGAALLCTAYDALTPAEAAHWSMTPFLQSLVDKGHPLEAVPVDGGWLEVDTVEDLVLYEQLISSNTILTYPAFPAAIEHSS